MIDDLVPLLGEYLPRQRWFAGDRADQITVLDSEAFSPEWPRLLWAVVDVDGAVYQLVLGGRPLGESGAFLGGHEAAVVGEVDGGFWYDATLDPELDLQLLPIVTGGAESARQVRPVGVEQSNTSLIYDDRVICKLFRRLHGGRNLDVEVTTALDAAGFNHIADPLATWERDGRDLAFAQRFLAGGAEGWALALTSLRDLYAVGPDDPAEAGGDFAAEAGRLGRMTAEMHLALAKAFGSEPGEPARWADGMEAGLEVLDDDQRRAAGDLLDRLRQVTQPGGSVRVHGDYHLGQVMRTDAGWFVLDFEGEPARPLEERRQPTSPMKDVAGMLRSFDYASRSVLAERDPSDIERIEPLALAWGQHNRDAFLRGYTGTTGIDRLLPGGEDATEAVLAAFELDKAVYELGYELAYRPTWVEIPRSAIRRLTGG